MRIARFVPGVLAAMCLSGAVTTSARAELVLPRLSPKASMTQTIGTTELSLTYSRPGVKDRVIWGGLVPYDTLWRTGANEATTLTCSTDITLGGHALPAGTYALLTIPTASDWTVIVSTQADLRGTVGYDAAKDHARVTVTPTTTADSQEWMWLGFDDLTPNSGNLVLRWEKLRLAIPIAVDVNAIVLANARTEVAAAKADDWRTPLRAATWCFENDAGLDHAKGWLDKSIGIQAGHSNLALKAKWLHKEGKKKEAIAAAKKAVEAGKAAQNPVDTSATEKLIAEWSQAK